MGAHQRRLLHQQGHQCQVALHQVPHQHRVLHRLQALLRSVGQSRRYLVACHHPCLVRHNHLYQQAMRLLTCQVRRQRQEQRHHQGHPGRLVCFHLYLEHHPPRVHRHHQVHQVHQRHLVGLHPHRAKHNPQSPKRAPAKASKGSLKHVLKPQTK